MEAKIKPGELSDDVLLNKAKQGDDTAFEGLVRKYESRLLGVLSAYMRNMDDAQDVAQESFIRAYRAIGQFRGDSAFSSWLYRIGLNTANNFISRHPRQRWCSLDALEAGGTSRGAMPESPDCPEREAMDAQLQQRVSDAIGRLPKHLKIAITLRMVDGCSYEQIASTMCCPIGTVRSRISRARIALWAEIGPMFALA